MEESERSFAKIEESDLGRLALLSREDRDEFFSRQPPGNNFTLTDSCASRCAKVLPSTTLMA